MKPLSLIKRFDQLFLSERTKKHIEKVILYIALISFFIHLVLIYLIKYDLIEIPSDSELMKNPISAIYTPFSFILIYEVYLLIYYLPKSFTTYITKQYEIITLIIIRKLFKDLSAIEFSTNWFDIKGDLQFTYDLLASLILFYLIFQFQKQGRRLPTKKKSLKSKIEEFITRKKIIAILLIPLFFIMALTTLINWSSEISFTLNQFPSFESINNLFFDEFFTVLILVDVILLLLSFFYTDQFHKIIRNSGFIVSTILIRLSFGVTGIMSTILILVAVFFGLIIIIIHNQYEKELIS
jgi:NADH:ubiquinone oxidoreductase subunit 6 (subunit J)